MSSTTTTTTTSLSLLNEIRSEWENNNQNHDYWCSADEISISHEIPIAQAMQVLNELLVHNDTNIKAIYASAHEEQVRTMPPDETTTNNTTIPCTGKKSHSRRHTVLLP